MEEDTRCEDESAVGRYRLITALEYYRHMYEAARLEADAALMSAFKDVAYFRIDDARALPRLRDQGR